MPIRLACSRGHALMAPERLKGRTLPCPKCGELVSIPGEPASQVVLERPSPATADAVFAGRDSVAKELPVSFSQVVTTTQPSGEADQSEKREVVPADKPKAIPTSPSVLSSSVSPPVESAKPPSRNEVPSDPPSDQAKALAESPNVAVPQLPAVTTDATPTKDHAASSSKAPVPVENARVEAAAAEKSVPQQSAPPASLPPPAPPAPAVEVKAPAPALPHVSMADAPAIDLLDEANNFDLAEFVLKVDAEGQANPYGHRKAAAVLLLTGLTLLIPTIWPLLQRREIDVLALPHWVYFLWLAVLLDIAYALLLVQVTHRYSRLATAGFLTLAAGFWAALAGITWLARGEHPLLNLLELNEPLARRAALFLSVIASGIHGVIACYCGMLGEEE